MTPAEVVATLASEGVELALRDGRLCVRPTPRLALVGLVRQHAPELRQFLDGATRAARDNADLAERLTERAAILEFDGGLDRTDADMAAVRIVQCSTCVHWTADPLGGDGIGTCATGADSRSWSAFDSRPLSAWPDAPRYCAGWEAARHG